MKIKNLSLLLIPFLLVGCNTENVTPQGGGGEGTPSGEGESGGDPSGEVDPSLDGYEKISLFHDLPTNSTLTTNSDLSHPTPKSKMDDYLQAKTGGIVSGYTVDNSFVQSDGQDGLYVVAGSKSNSGRFTLNFSQEMKAINITVSVWKKYNSHDEVWNIEETVAFIDFGYKNEVISLLKAESGLEEDSLLIYGTDDPDASSYNEWIKVSSTFDEMGQYDSRVVIKQMDLYYEKTN